MQTFFLFFNIFLGRAPIFEHIFAGEVRAFVLNLLIFFIREMKSSFRYKATVS